MTEPLDLDPIKARLAAATPGPWIIGTDVVSAENGATLLAAPYGWHEDGDADLLATVHDDLAALIAEVERLRESLRLSGEGFERRGRLLDKATLENIALRESLEGTTPP